MIWRHGYTYSGHASACAAGLAVTRIYSEEGVFARALELETELLDTPSRAWSALVQPFRPAAAPEPWPLSSSIPPMPLWRRGWRWPFARQA